ncbi:MAG: hypothetical protein ACFFDB_11615 [Promethearchaeota archaeon]
MIKDKRRIKFTLLFVVFLLNSILIIQNGSCQGYDTIWKFKAGDKVMDIAISNDGSTIAIVGYDRQLHLLSSESSSP